MHRSVRALGSNPSGIKDKEFGAHQASLHEGDDPIFGANASPDLNNVFNELDNFMNNFEANHEAKEIAEGNISRYPTMKKELKNQDINEDSDDGWLKRLWGGIKVHFRNGKYDLRGKNAFGKTVGPKEKGLSIENGSGWVTVYKGGSHTNKVKRKGTVHNKFQTEGGDIRVSYNFNDAPNAAEIEYGSGKINIEKTKGGGPAGNLPGGSNNGTLDVKVSGPGDYWYIKIEEYRTIRKPLFNFQWD